MAMEKENDPEEREYNPSFWSRRHKRNKALLNHALLIYKLSTKINEKIPHRSKVKYGDSERCIVDIYSEDLPRTSPIFVFVHGGAWIAGNNDLYGYIAEPFRDSGIVVITVEYDLAPFATLTKMVEEVKQSLTFIVNLARERGSKGIYLSGHSAGAHLLAMAISSDWLDDVINQEYLKAVVLVSGVYDLSPIVKMSFGSAANFTQENAETTSPVKVINEMSKRIRPDIKVFVAVGEFDPPKFIEQAKTYHQALTTAGVSSQFLCIENEDHFTVIEKLYDKKNILTKTCIKLCCKELYNDSSLLSYQSKL